MADSPLLEPLVTLAGSVFSGAGSDRLEDVDRAVVAALRHGQTQSQMQLPTSPLRPWPDAGSMLDTFRLQTFRALLAEADQLDLPRTLVLRRTHEGPAGLTPHALPAWARGRRPSHTLGPFPETTVRPVWFDVYESTVTTLITRASVAVGRPDEPLVAFTPLGDGGRRGFELAPAAVWLRAAMFDPAAPSDAWFGIDVTGGRLGGSRPFGEGPAPAVVRVDSDTQLRVQATLSQASASAAEPGAGEAARACGLSAPQEIVLDLTQQGASLSLAGDLVLSVGQAAATLPPVPGAPLRYDAALGAMVLPLDPGPSPLDAGPLRGPTWQLDGSASVIEAALAFPVARASGAVGPDTLGAVSGTPAVHLRLGAGLDLRTEVVQDSGSPVRVPLSESQLLVRTGELWFAGTPPERLPGEEWLEAAWHAPADRTDAAAEVRLRATGLSSLEVTSLAQPDAPAVDTITRVGAPFRAVLGAPRTAAGPLVVKGAATVLDLWDGSSRAVVLHASTLAPDLAAQRRSFMLDNALVRTTGVTSLVLESARGEGPATLAAGWITCGLAMDSVVPVLPHPYASDVLPWTGGDREPADVRGAELVAAADWRHEDAPPEVAFGLPVRGRRLLGGTGTVRADPPEPEARRALDRYYRPGRVRGHDPARCHLLDVSGGADFLGVSLHPGARTEEADASEPLRLDGTRLTQALRYTDLLLLPGFLNEPLGNLVQPAAADPFPDQLAPLGDGGPQRLMQATEQPVPVDPPTVAQALVAGFDETPLNALLSLPFGMRAVARLDAAAEGGGSVELVPPEGMAEESGLQPQWQLRLRATSDGEDRGPDAATPSIPGTAHQLRLGHDSGQVFSALGAPFDDTFNTTFSALAGATSPRVPVQGVDVAGHGNSVMSAWLDPTKRPGHPLAVGSNVSEVRFQALVGRTTLEVVQITSMCHPFRIPLVRQVTLRRSRAGAVWRSDSGWQPAGDGLVDYPTLQTQPELGVFRALRSVRGIRELPETAVGPGGTRFRAVRFDAMAEVDGLGELTPVHDVHGWVELDPRPQGVTDAAVLDLLLQPSPGTGRGGCFGRLDAAVDVARSGQLFRGTALGIEWAGPGPLLAGVLRGMPVLPVRGDWAVVRRDPAAVAHRRLHPGETVPLTGRGDDRYLREAADLLAAQPQTDYAILHASDAHRLLVPDPKVAAGDTRITPGRAPLFADQFALANHAGAMPPQDVCVALAGTALEVPEPGHLRLLSAGGGGVDVEVPGGGAWREIPLDAKGPNAAMRLEYRGLDERRARLRLAIDTREPTRHWSLELGQLCITTDYEIFGRFCTTAGVLRAGSDRVDDVEDVVVEFSGALGTAQSFMDIMRSLSLPPTTDASEAPGSVGERPERAFSPVYFGKEFDLPVGTKPKVTPPHDDDRWDLEPAKGWADFGGGKIKAKIGIFLRIDHLEQSVHRETNLVHGLKFEIGGKLLVPIIGPIWGGGALKLTYEYVTGADPGVGQYFQPRKESHEFELQGGFVGYLGADFKAFAAELSVATLHVLEIKNEVHYGLKYQFEGQADILDGLAGVAIGFECMCSPRRGKDEQDQHTEEVNFHLEAEVVLEATLGWVFSGEAKVHAETDIQLGMPTFAAFALGNPYLLAAEAL
ncbi:hypothetical protein SAMN05216184_101332 [Georgenia satyanarayanai]|uniref:Uncharacterized protein n=1 Tax=Georgenia satyanarayanai TaxID=860221 RepID=A0A2Y8ZWG4_9MICO|nr:hypothetical protein [Georgenia satyanarayanai]PYG01867.1 hypothetical protein A8987_101332 [Georgenia satyanarayanai]SSA36670.1 hypothetical protein SAMN05216184_101332 [Georgenia satyanarayanai]